MVNKKSARLSNNSFAAYIDKKLKETNKSYSRLADYCNFPRAYITRMKAGKWIPTPRQCTDVAGFLNVPWDQVWIAAGHIRQDEIDRLKTRRTMPYYRLDNTEAEIIDSYRFCNELASVYLTSAVRGAARASENMQNGYKRQHRVYFLLEMDFVNYPEWLANVPATYINEEHPKVFKLGENMNVDYLAQSTIVGTLRYTQTKTMSQLPYQLWAD